MASKTYTAQEMRQTAEMDFYVTKLGIDDRPNLTDEIRSMLRQGADAEEENAQLKARLQAVVKEIKGRDWINDGNLADAILRAANGGEYDEMVKEMKRK